VQIYRHFVQIWRARQFQAFDYGSTKNLQLYGSARPLSMLDNYKYIDIPVAFCYGSGDVLIAPANVKAHFAAMRPEMATLHEFKDAGHLEFTVGLTDQIISTILDIISSMKSK
jgi:pimeloyl-ACP methyl ester carboxylesterase